MSLRQQNLGSIIKPGYNPLATPPLGYTYYADSWGLNSSGQLGLGNLGSYSSPRQIGTLTNWSSLVSGGAFGMAIKTDGTLWSWGYNSFGQLGLNNTVTYSSPKQIGALTTWLSIACGYQFTAAIKTDGTLWVWGRNDYGQLGVGNTTGYSSPKQVGALTTWASVSSGTGPGSSYAVATKTDGTLWAWGRNDTGQLAQGNITNRSSPVQVGALTNWLRISGGEYSAHAVKTDGTLWGWGRNSNGELGDGSVTNRSSPVQIGLLSNWSTPVDGSNFGTALKTDGTLWSWGRNNWGQLGNSNITYYSSPRQIGALTNWSSVGAGGNACCFFIKTNGTLWSWGNNSNGKLGLGNITNYSSPKQIGTGTTWYKISTGDQFTLGLLY